MSVCTQHHFAFGLNYVLCNRNRNELSIPTWQVCSYTEYEYKYRYMFVCGSKLVSEIETEHEVCANRKCK